MQKAQQNITLVENQESKRVLAGVLAILLGGFGVHKFVLGYHKEGFIMLIAGVLPCFMGLPITCLIGFVEGIIYLSKSDESFFLTYEKNKKTWF